MVAAVLVVDELGWSGATVAHITGRARISRRTFYDLFESREDCLLAVLRDVVERIGSELEGLGLDALSWRERVCAGLWTILCFFDREPLLARLCVVQSARGGERVLAYREEVFAILAGVLREGEGLRARECPPSSLMAEGLVGAALAIVHKRLLGKGEQARLGGLLGDLVSILALPYLGPAAASRERARPAPPVPAAVARVSGRVLGGVAVGVDPLRDVPMRLTYRTARVLDGVATHPGASNRLIADHAGITDQGQASKLLARLERLGLLANTGAGHAKGEPNQWSLTRKGIRVQRSIDTHIDDHERTPA
jgi:AcrR family transcriptional regulator